ncbi:unnamed protein product [Protopolystoma xenopodis]|uniref:Uncharacterized protein n=1 Tax=Protopolystoma xenopodis TaxID=117903 RepID=A0A448XRP7_9PLAT|nr:unnamed protein product [Protopolystoma xenopodis]
MWPVNFLSSILLHSPPHRDPTHPTLTRLGMQSVRPNTIGRRKPLYRIKSQDAPMHPQRKIGRFPEDGVFVCVCLYVGLLGLLKGRSSQTWISRLGDSGVHLESRKHMGHRRWCNFLKFTSPCGEGHAGGTCVRQLPDLEAAYNRNEFTLNRTARPSIWYWPWQHINHQPTTSLHPAATPAAGAGAFNIEAKTHRKIVLHRVVCCTCPSAHPSCSPCLRLLVCPHHCPSVCLSMCSFIRWSVHLSGCASMSVVVLGSSPAGRAEPRQPRVVKARRTVFRIADSLDGQFEDTSGSYMQPSQLSTLQRDLSLFAPVAAAVGTIAEGT